MTETPVTERQLIAVMAAAFAVSNMGMTIDQDRLRWMTKYDRHMVTARSAVSDYASGFIENDTMEEIFVTEAEGWERDIQAMGLRHFINTYGTHNGWLSIFKELLP